jgi:hypothetical protein
MLTDLRRVRKGGKIMVAAPTGEMTETNLLITAQIFWPDGDWKKQKRFYYDPENKRRFYKVDCYSERMKIIWEYEGPDHYNNVWKLKRDDERKKYFETLGYEFLRWPYYLQLTEDVAKHFFKNDFSMEKFQEAFQTIYKVDSPDLILSPGLHQSKHTPANFVANGVRRFFAELDALPQSVRRQLAEGLRRYISAVDDPFLVIGEQPEFKVLLESEVGADDAEVYYFRDTPSEYYIRGRQQN